MWSKKPPTNANVARRTQKLLRYTQAGNSRKTAQKLAGLGHRVQEGVEAINAEGKTPLIHAILAGSYETVKALLESGANPNNPGQTGKPPINWAIDNNKYRIAQVLFASGVDVNKVEENTDSIIFRAISSGDIELIKVLLAAKINLHVGNRTNYTPLLWAVKGNNPTIVKLLLAGGANPNVMNPADRTSPLMTARKDANGLEIIDMLVTAGAHIDKKSGAGETPLFRAVLEDDSYLPKVKKLIEHGADVEAEDSNGASPLTGAITQYSTLMRHGRQGNLEIIKYLWTFPSEHKTRLIDDTDFREAIFDNDYELFNTVLGLTKQSSLPEAQSGLILVFDLDNTIYDCEDCEDYKPLKQPCINKRIESILIRAAALRGKGVDAICMLTNNALYDFIYTVDQYLLNLTQSVGKFAGIPEANPLYAEPREKQFLTPAKIFSAINPDGHYFFDHILTRLADVRRFNARFVRTNMDQNILCNASFPGERDTSLKRMVDIEYMAHKAGVPISTTHPEEDIMRRSYFFDDLDTHTITREMSYLYDGKYKDHFIQITPAFKCGVPDQTNLSKIEQLLTNLERKSGGKRSKRRTRKHR